LCSLLKRSIEIGLIGDFHTQIKLKDFSTNDSALTVTCNDVRMRNRIVAKKMSAATKAGVQTLILDSAYLGTAETAGIFFTFGLAVIAEKSIRVH